MNRSQWKGGWPWGRLSVEVTIGTAGVLQQRDYWQVREQVSRVNIMEVLLAYVQVQTEKLWRGFLWENPERGNLQCERGGMAYQERRRRQEDKQAKRQDDGFPSRSRSQRYNKGASTGTRVTTGDASKMG